jgi:hypothetical protein
MRRLLSAACACLFASGCGMVGDAWYTGWTDAAARDRIMLVRAAPESLGHQRLVHQSRIYPDLAVFLERKGWPDFIAETANDGQRYVVLYYLGRGEAWAARTNRSVPRLMEFAGPYPMTPNERRLLRQLQMGESPPGFRPEDGWKSAR